MSVRDILMTVLSSDDANDVIEHRRVTIKKPLTERAAKMMVREMQKWGNPAEAVELMIKRCWRGFEADWAASALNRPAQGQIRPATMAEFTRNLLDRMEDERTRPH